MQIYYFILHKILKNDMNLILFANFAKINYYYVKFCKKYK